MQKCLGETCGKKLEMKRTERIVVVGHDVGKSIGYISTSDNFLRFPRFISHLLQERLNCIHGSGNRNGSELEINILVGTRR